MIDQIKVGGESSYRQYDASVKERTIKDGKKKEIKDSVPFSNQTYDFSGINGEVYWEEKELEYVFEIEANTPEELEEKKIFFKSWIMNITEQKLYDPFIPNYHFIATFDSIDVDDSEVLKSTIEVTFKAYPYMIANQPKRQEFTLVANETTTLHFTNISSHKITPTIYSTVGITVTVNSTMAYAVSSGLTTSPQFVLEPGAIRLDIKSTFNGSGYISFIEEVF